MNLLHALPATLEELTLRGLIKHFLDIDSLPCLRKLKCLKVGNSGDPICECFLAKVLLSMPNLIELDFDRFFWEKGDCYMLRSLIGNPIRKIILRGKFEDQSLMNVIRCYSDSLEELSIPIEALMENNLIPKFPKLTKCTVYWTELFAVSGEDMTRLLQPLIESMPNIVDLSLQDSNCECFYELLPLKCLQAMMKHCPKIKTLGIPQVYPSTDVLLNARPMLGVTTLKTSCSGKTIAYLGTWKSLQNLHLTHMVIEDRDIFLLITCLKHLQDLDITRCEKVTGQFIELKYPG